MPKYTFISFVYIHLGKTNMNNYKYYKYTAGIRDTYELVSWWKMSTANTKRRISFNVIKNTLMLIDTKFSTPFL